MLLLRTANWKEPNTKKKEIVKQILEQEKLKLNKRWNINHSAAFISISFLAGCVYETYTQKNKRPHIENKKKKKP